MNIRKPLDQQSRAESAPISPAATIAIENIGRMRRAEGIDDYKLEAEVARLEVGNVVRLTLRTSGRHVECVLVRIVNKHKLEFTGELVTPAAEPQLQRLVDGVTLNFSADHIHSIHKTQDAVVACDR